jgi:SsrA-binding protein
MALLRNDRIGFDYQILEEIEAGLELLGLEVKSLRAGQGSLKGARVVARGGEAYLVGATIPAWQVLNAPKSYDATRTRKLLLSKKEIAHVASAEGQAGLTIVPISVYNKGRKLKLSIGIARGKKKADKRQDIKKRDDERRIRRTLKSGL